MGGFGTVLFVNAGATPSATWLGWDSYGLNCFQISFLNKVLHVLDRTILSQPRGKNSARKHQRINAVIIAVFLSTLIKGIR
jgi:hypothetical protein